MPIDQLKPLVFAWWNTSLSPLGKTRANPSEKSYAETWVRTLFEEMGVDLLAVGEVCSQDIVDIERSLQDLHLKFYDGTNASGKNHFDTAVIFNPNRFVLDSSVVLTDEYARKTLKTGEILKLICAEINEYIYVIVSHWPSRLHVAESDPVRTEIGASLRRRFDEIRRDSPTPPYIVLMGDFNDDPCSPSLALHLLATRDRELARSRDEFLYNPFWRKLGESDPISQRTKQNSICGTYYYRSGAETRWHTFDQIIVSSAFLGGGSLQLNEEMTQIVRRYDHENRVRDAAEIFDHLPVLTVFDIWSRP